MGYEIRITWKYFDGSDILGDDIEYDELVDIVEADPVAPRSPDPRA